MIHDTFLFYIVLNVWSSHDRLDMKCLPREKHAFLPWGTWCVTKLFNPFFFISESSDQKGHVLLKVDSEWRLAFALTLRRSASIQGSPAVCESTVSSALFFPTSLSCLEVHQYPTMPQRWWGWTGYCVWGPWFSPLPPGGQCDIPQRLVKSFIR